MMNQKSNFVYILKFRMKRDETCELYGRQLFPNCQIFHSYWLSNFIAYFIPCFEHFIGNMFHIVVTVFPSTTPNYNKFESNERICMKYGTDILTLETIPILYTC